MLFKLTFILFYFDSLDVSFGIKVYKKHFPLDIFLALFNFIKGKRVHTFSIFSSFHKYNII